MANDLIAPGEISALLGRGTEYSGTLTFEGRVRLDGRFEGKVFSGGTLVVGEGAEVRADIEVGTLIALGGELWGAVVARDLVELHAGATVHGDIETPRLFIDKGAVFDGRCTMGDQEPERVALSEEQLLDELAAESISEAFHVDGIHEGDSAEDTTPGVILDRARSKRDSAESERFDSAPPEPPAESEPAKGSPEVEGEEPAVSGTDAGSHGTDRHQKA